MTTLSLRDVETVVAAAWDCYLEQDPRSFHITVGGHRVRVTIELRGKSFDCGMPGFRMAKGDVGGLRAWVPVHIKIERVAGYLTPCKNVGPVGQVNVHYPGDVLFNFHVNLDQPC
jgi:hypothetical protein